MPWMPVTSSWLGPSPRARGNPPIAALAIPGMGTIPACAGEPSGQELAGRRLGDHPRVRGGTIASVPTVVSGMGPSPRARGNPRRPPPRRWLPRTIPACAGEPQVANSGESCHRDHPRVLGGTAASNFSMMPSGGPSPRARGNPPAALERHQLGGTIPACAGEPRAIRLPSPPYRDHPRVRGGTPVLLYQFNRGSGPSPRARGNLCGLSGPEYRLGTIPACAGEPPSTHGTNSPPRDHPRVRGGTGIARHLTRRA